MGLEGKADKEMGTGNRLDKIERQINEVVSSNAVLQALGSKPLSSDNVDEIDLRELWSVIWSGKWIIIATIFVFSVTSVIYALSLPDLYKSEALLAPAEENSGGGLAGLAGQFGGLASLAGVDLGGRGNDKTALALEVLKSREFISNFIENHDLLLPLMAADGWKRETNELSINVDYYDLTENKWVRNVSFPFMPKPSMSEAYQRLSGFLSVSQSKDTGFISLGIEFYSPVVAKQWVSWLVEDINSAVKARDVAEAQRSIQYLTSQLEKTSIADMQTVFFELIEEQTKTVMFAEVRDEYVFKTIDPPVIPDLRSKPSRVIILIVGAMIGGLVGLGSVFIRYFLKNGLDASDNLEQ